MYDVIVIGGGPGGYAASIRVSQLGGRVAMVESADLGGTCVNRGCIPTKIWLQAAWRKKAIETGEEFGIRAQLEGIDLSAIVNRKREVPNDIKKGMKGLCASNKIEIIPEMGILKSPKTLEAGGKILEAKNIIIATGSSLVMPHIPGLAAAAVTTDEIIEMTEIPASILVNGGGPIEVEMAAILNAFGAKVHLVTDHPRILPMEDGDTSRRIAKALGDQGIEIARNSNLKSVKKGKSGFDAKLSGKEESTVSVERIMVSSRKPNTDLGLDQVEIQLDEEGFIRVNENMQTNIAGIYAIGDVTGGGMLSHAATAMGICAAENVMGQPTRFQGNLIPHGLYSMPEAASVGITEEQADEQDLEVEIGVCPFKVNGLAMAYGELEGAAKVITGSEYGEILGVHVVGGHATEMIWGAVLAIRAETTIEDFAYTMALHPTFSENITMAGQDVLKWALYLPKRR